MTLTAIISDIHSNMHALGAVVDDARARGAGQFWCLGDIVGYGAQPMECLEVVRELSSHTLKGNHEQAVLEGPFGFNPLASAAIMWTRSRVETGSESMRDGMPFLEELAERKDLDSATLVHGSPSHPLDEYLFREDTLEFLPQRMEERPKLARCFERIERPCFVGHTHVPGVIDQELRWISPAGCADGYDTEGKSCFINVGSVGQPRDGDRRASYALWDGRHAHFRRVEYDFAAAAELIFREADLPDMLGQRLIEAW